jgi:hypothetical protein
MFGGSTDTKLILYVKHIENTGVSYMFLSVLPLDIATADGYLHVIQEELERRGLLGWLTSCKLLGIGTDGAAGMVGGENGLIKKLRQSEPCDWCSLFCTQITSESTCSPALFA